MFPRVVIEYNNVAESDNQTAQILGLIVQRQYPLPTNMSNAQEATSGMFPEV